MKRRVRRLMLPFVLVRRASVALACILVRLLCVARHASPSRCRWWFGSALDAFPCTAVAMLNCAPVGCWSQLRSPRNSDNNNNATTATKTTAPFLGSPADPEDWTDSAVTKGFRAHLGAIPKVRARGDPILWTQRSVTGCFKLAGLHSILGKVGPPNCIDKRSVTEGFAEGGGLVGPFPGHATQT